MPEGALGTAAPVRIVTAPAPPPLTLRAAHELRDLLTALFGVQAQVGPALPGSEPGARFLLGQPGAAPFGDLEDRLPRLSPQGHLVRRLDAQTMALAGGSPAAVCWAVYELAEQYGVTFLLHGDVFPETPGPFHLPQVDRHLEPVLRLRSWRQFNDLPTSPGLWTLSQQRAFIRQIFKLRYNGIYLCLWPHHPFVHFELHGIRRRTACLLFGQHIPIDADTMGHEHRRGVSVLDNPELAAAQTYEEKLVAGQRLLRGILSEARDLGLHTAVHFQPLEFPAEFRELLQQPTRETIQLGGLTCAEQGDLTHPTHMALIAASFRAHLEQCVGVDEFHLSLPEHPHAEQHYERCWDELDHRHGLERVTSLATVIAHGTRNALVPGGLERAAREVKSSISILHFVDRLFATTDLLERATAQGATVHLNLGGNSEPLFPILGHVLWPGAGITTSLGYTASRAVRAMRAMDHLDTARVPATLVVTLQDDNVGSLPQVATRSIHQLLDAAAAHGWRGFFTRHWPIGDLDPVAAFMARRSWDATVTPATAYDWHFARVYGPAAARPMARVMDLLEDTTVILDLDFLGLLFPVLGVAARALAAPAPWPPGLAHVRAAYEEAARQLQAVEPALTGSASRREWRYWRSRVDFAIGALEELEWLQQAADHAAQLQPGAAATGDEQARSRAQACIDQALQAGERALAATATTVRDETDAHTQAAYYHFLVREVREAAAAVLGTAWSPPDARPNQGN